MNNDAFHEILKIKGELDHLIEGAVKTELVIVPNEKNSSLWEHSVKINVDTAALAERLYLRGIRRVEPSETLTKRSSVDPNNPTVTAVKVNS